MRKYIQLLVILLIFCSVPSLALEPINVKGYLRQGLTIDHLYFRPNKTDWAWELWYGTGYPVYGRPLNPSSSQLVGWGGSNLFLEFTMGSVNKPVYIYYPILFYTTIFREDMAQLLRSSNDYVFLFQGDSTTFSLSSRMIENNPLWSFVDMDDPLGAFKLPNTFVPRMTLKAKNNYNDWDSTGYILFDYMGRFLPLTDKIPESVFTAITNKEVEQQATLLEETPVYQLFRTSKRFTNGWQMGLNFGNKRSSDVRFRLKDDSSIAPKDLGYSKTNYGLDLEGTLPFMSHPTFSLAVLSSTGQWRRYKREDGYSDYLSLGEINGNALKVGLEHLYLGRASIKSNYIKVDPGFQLVAARDSRYAYTYGFYDPTGKVCSPYRYPQAVLDENFIRRDPNRKEDYLSDVATYLGVSYSDTTLSIPGEIELLGASQYAEFKLGISYLKRLDPELDFFDPYQGITEKDDYTQVDFSLDLGYYPSTKTVFGRNKLYGLDKDYFRELGFSSRKNLSSDLTLVEKASFLQRHSTAEGTGSTILGELSLEGKNPSGVKTESKIKYAYGDYEPVRGRDGVHIEPHSFLELLQFAESTLNVSYVGNTRITTQVAGEVFTRITDFPELANGTSLVGYMLNNVYFPDTTVRLTSVGVAGPKGDSAELLGFSSSGINSLIDCFVSYRIAGSANDTWNFQLTKRFMDHKVHTNFNTSLRSRMGRHTLTLSYGRGPNFGRSGYIAGTMLDSRFQPAEELMNRPWAYWGDRSIYAADTHEKYFNMNWTIYF